MKWEHVLRWWAYLKKCICLASKTNSIWFSAVSWFFLRKLKQVFFVSFSKILSNDWPIQRDFIKWCFSPYWPKPEFQNKVFESFICANLKIVDYLQPLIQVSLSPSFKSGTGRIQAGKSFQASSHINAIFIACLSIISISLSVYAQLIRLQFAKYASKKVDTYTHMYIATSVAHVEYMHYRHSIVIQGKLLMYEREWKAQTSNSKCLFCRLHHHQLILGFDENNVKILC